jgi:polar amino acid transport system substrate-binding protein
MRRGSTQYVPHRLRGLLAVPLLAAALVFAACGESEEPASNNAAAGAKLEDPAIAKLVPQEIRDRGELIIGTNAPYPPLEFFAEDNKTLVGFDIDLGYALADVLGLKATWKNTGFDSIIPGLSAGRYDIGIAGFGVEPERLEVVDFIGYYLSGGGFLVKKGSGIEVNDFKDTMCGLRVAVQKGTSQVEKIHGAKEYCAANGKEPVTILEIPDQNVVVLTLASGRADVVSADKPAAEYAAKQSNGQLCMTGSYRTLHSIAGVAVPKRWPPEFNEALQQAVQKLIDSGEYQRIAEKWGTGVAGSQTEVSEEYHEISKAWGVGLDGAVKEAKIFTDPNEIDGGKDIFPQPIREGCA